MKITESSHTAVYPESKRTTTGPNYTTVYLYEINDRIVKNKTVQVEQSPASSYVGHAPGALADLELDLRVQSKQLIEMISINKQSPVDWISFPNKCSRNSTLVVDKYVQVSQKFLHTDNT